MSTAADLGAGAPPGRVGAVGSAARRLARTHWIFVLVLLGGVLMRVAMMIALPQPMMPFTDANVYVRAAQEYLFRPLEGRTAGYPLFLRIAHGISDGPLLPVVLQHLMSLVGGILLYATARRVRVPRGLAALAAATWLLSIDWLWLEHQLLTETLASLLTMCAIAAIVLVPLDRWRRGWRPVAAVAVVIVLAGALAMGSGIVRPALFPALPGVGLCTLLLMRARPVARVAASGLLVLVCLVVLLGYLHEQEEKTGFYGIVGSPPAQDLGGYPAIAPLADCSRFRVPPGTRALCETTPSDDRRGPDYYYWDGSSPGRKLLAARPELNAAIKLWAGRATEAQADDLQQAKFVAFQRLFGFGGLVREGTDQGTQILNLEGADVNAAGVAVDAINAYYGPGSAPNPPAGTPWGVLTTLQPFTRPSGLVMLLCAVLLLAGVLLGHGIARRAALAFGVGGWLPVVFATYTGSQFNWRYVVPSVPFIALAAVTAGAALMARVAKGRASRTGAAGRDEETPGRDGAPGPEIGGAQAAGGTAPSGGW